MAIYTAAQIYAFARRAGFTPDQAVTMTAIALAESGGDSTANATRAEDSRGLWQINMQAHPQWAGMNAYDPAVNARLAYQVSHGGQDISPWTVTHGGDAARYLANRAKAQQAAIAYGDHDAHGNWAGTAGYGHPVPAAGSDASQHTSVYGDGYADDSHGGHQGAGDGFGNAQGHGGNDQIGPTTQHFLEAALAQAGKHYVYGAEADLHDPNPQAFDCSELTQWAAAQAGVEIPDGAEAQYDALRAHGQEISVDEAFHTPGALLFHANPDGSVSHVAISLGDGRTIEARNSKLGVGVFDHRGDWLNRAAVLPGLSAPVGSGPPAHGFGPASAAFFGPDVGGSADPDGTAGAAGLDSDHDGLTDALERALGTDPHSVDSDHDGISDGYEVLHTHTDPTNPDTDHDGLRDGFELARGLDPTRADSGGTGHLDGATGPDAALDSDHDGLTDALERILGTDPFAADTDHDGVTDGAERQLGLNPLDGHDVNALLSPHTGAAGPAYSADTADTLADDPYRDNDVASHGFEDDNHGLGTDDLDPGGYPSHTGHGDIGHL
jgi:cell wall-associated NlpC family hydrolase